MYTSSTRDNIARKAGTAANDMAEDVATTTGRAASRMSDTFKAANEKLYHAADTTASHVREKPIQYTLMAVGIGYALAMLFRR